MNAPLLLAVLSLVASSATTTSSSSGMEPKAPRAQPIQAHYDLHVSPEDSMVDVVARFSGLPDGPLVLSMSPEGSFVRLDQPLLAGRLEAQAGDTALDVEWTRPYGATIQTGGATEIECRWSVPQTHRELDAVRAHSDGYEWPYLDEDHGLLVTATLIFRPDKQAVDSTVRVHVPDGWSVEAPWPEREPGLFVPDAGLTYDLLAVGNWERHEVELEGFRATVLVAPGQDGLMDAVAGPIETIVKAELELFERAPRERYLFLFGLSSLQGFAGSPKHGSMTLTVGAPAISRADKYVPHLVAHEFFHTWAASTTRLPDELRWFNEGVTDYYAHLISARTGLTSWDEFAAQLGRAMTTVETSPLWGASSLAEAGGPRFFEGADHYHLVYSGGLVLGAWIDLALRTRHGTTLDAAMRTFLNDPRWSDRNVDPTPADWYAVLAKLGDEELASTVASLAEEPVEVDFVALFTDVGVPVQRTDSDAGPVYSVPASPWDRTPR